jgi:salicylate hydroxylase
MRAAMALEAMHPAPPRAPAQMPEGKGSANQWADRSKNVAQFGYDADADADRWWDRHGREVLTIGREQKAAKL